MLINKTYRFDAGLDALDEVVDEVVLEVEKGLDDDLLYICDNLSAKHYQIFQICPKEFNDVL